MTAAAIPPPSDARGATTERLPLTSPRKTQARPPSSHRPLTTAYPAAVHSVEPLGTPSVSNATGRRMTRPAAITHINDAATGARRTTLTIT